jgi:NADH dehydrogenase
MNLTGVRMSMPTIEPATRPTVCLLGGTGFVGHHLAALLSARGYRLRIPTRRGARHPELRVLPGVELVRADVHDEPRLRRLLEGCGAAINLVGILNEERRGDFQRVHVELPRRLVQACREAGTRRLLHMSALNAGAPGARSRYLITKGEGEALVHAAEGVRVTSFRPAVIFGPGDHFFNRFARLLRWSPFVMPLACAEARLAPVFVGDVAHAMVASLQNDHTIGQRYELCGPRVYTLEALVRYTARMLGIRRAVLGLGNGLSALQARIAGHLPGRPFTYDNYLSLRIDAVCQGRSPEPFGRAPAAVESEVPIYLGQRNQRQRLAEFRTQARRSA